MIRFCGTTPNSTALGPLLKLVFYICDKYHIFGLCLFGTRYQNVSRSICMQICYTDMLPFEDIPDDTVPVTAYLKVMYG